MNTIISNMPVSKDTPIGTQVRPSEYALRPKRDYWLSCGRCSEKSAAKAEYEAATNKRGTITAHLEGGGVEVKWDNGTESSCLTYMIVTA